MSEDHDALTAAHDSDVVAGNDVTRGRPAGFSAGEREPCGPPNLRLRRTHKPRQAIAQRQRRRFGRAQQLVPPIREGLALPRRQPVQFSLRRRNVHPRGLPGKTNQWPPGQIRP